MSRNTALKNLFKSRYHHPTLPPALRIPDPSSSLSAITPSTTAAAAQAQLIRLTAAFESYLEQTPASFTPKDLLHFIRSRLRHHPALGHLDYHLFRFAATLDSFRHDHHTFEYMVRSLASTDRLDSLRSLLEFISSNPCPCSDGIFSCPKIEPMFRVSIRSFCRSGRFDDALYSFDIMRRLIDGKPDVSLYNIMIHGFVKLGKLEKGVEFYERIFRDRVKPDAVTFNTLINGYCKSNKLAHALKVFDEMKKKGCVPNVVSFNILIKGFFREGNADQAVMITREMIELSCDFSCASCDILVDGLSQSGKVIEAASLMNEFLRKGVLPKGYDSFVLVEILCREGKADKAFELVDQLWSHGYNPSSIACTALVEGLRGMGELEKSAGLVRRMLEGGILPDYVTFCCVLRDMCGGGSAWEANELQLLACKKGLYADSMVYRILVSGCIEEGRKEEGEVLVNEMLDRGFLPDIASHNMLMDGLAKSKASRGVEER